MLTTTPILKVPDMDTNFLVYIDTSKEGLGRVLMQDSRVITYRSRKLRRNEENYVMHDLELLAIVFALKVGDTTLLEKKLNKKNGPLWTKTHIYAKRPERATMALVGIA
jgi:hypothetical protein